MSLFSTDTKADQLREILRSVACEFGRATSLNGPFGSAHEGYAVILEEVDELWDEVKKKSTERSIDQMREEAIQIAAMAVRFINDLCLPDQQ